MKKMLKSSKPKAKGITIKRAAELLQVSVATLRNWDTKGVLTPRRDPKNGYRYYSIGALERFAKKNNLRRNENRKVLFVP